MNSEYGKEHRIKIQKQVADTSLYMLRHVDPTAIIAGGAPRDWWFGKVATDIDLFFHFRPDLQIGKIAEILKEVGFSLRSLKEGKLLPELYKKNPDLRCVFDVNMFGDSLQLMLMNKPTFRLVDTFPLSICKVWYKNRYIYTTKDFDNTVGSGIITLTNTLYNDGDKYVKKVLSKFPSYKYQEFV